MKARDVIKKLRLTVAATLMLLASCTAGAASTSSMAQGDLRVTVTAEPCELVADKRFHKAMVVWKGDNLKACWADLDAENILVVDETGDAGAVPKRLFKPDQEA